MNNHNTQYKFLQHGEKTHDGKEFFGVHELRVPNDQLGELYSLFAYLNEKHGFLVDVFPTEDCYSLREGFGESEYVPDILLSLEKLKEISSIVDFLSTRGFNIIVSDFIVNQENFNSSRVQLEQHGAEVSEALINVFNSTDSI